ncbi:hypothetical protein GON26_20545 [Flavobacterium sp. GA093]|uniref:Uncharacterized protein n=1 Tax=Flavobacterium hydrocarbonoxydans TaxID=2683249 RepID=A0A6I4NQP3_9FLAO|nr:hypothetical protein [Flavobacterium hydrocarbonoxydans]MWB96758.1 hypothetical protein [Flavobacterium hydrocarbonoxydans]
MLDKERLKGKIRSAFADEQNEQSDYNKSLDNISEKIAQAVIDEVKQAKIQYVSGLISPTSGGPVTGTITHTIS